MRDPKNCVITFSAPVLLREAIKRAAEAERRTVSNWIVLQLEAAMKEHKEYGVLRVAEPKTAKYRTGNSHDHSSH